MRVIGTAGHVDHGKSTLVAALTGTHPDRLKEEREREMTIDLGFAWMNLPDGEQVGIVDVPGHRDFIENMLAGVGGIDAVIFVIAADEGVMPQTREHLAILDLLQIESGIIALTKVDLVEDADWLDMVELDVYQAVKGTVLENAPLARVSAKTGNGISELISLLVQTLARQPQRADLGRPRLPVDRVFSMPGFGAIVTGTLLDGCFRTGDEVLVLPNGLKARVRGLQTHKSKEEIAHPGSRVAMNLSGVDVNEVHRGDVIATAGKYAPTQRLDGFVRILADASTPISHDDEVKLFAGASETTARVRVLGADTIAPGEEGFVQLETTAPVVVARRDRFILRRPSPGETIGGGQVLNPFPEGRHKRFVEPVLAELKRLLAGTPEDILLQAAGSGGFNTVRAVLERSRLPMDGAQAALHNLIELNEMILLSGQATDPEGLLMTAAGWSGLSDLALRELAAFHKAYPLRTGMPREELKSRLKLAPRHFLAALERWKQAGEVEELNSMICIAGRRVRLAEDQQRRVDLLLERFRANPYSPPSVKECSEALGIDLYNAILDQGFLVGVSTEVVFRKEDYQAILEIVREHFSSEPTLTLAQLRDRLSTSRKYVQAFLEHLDAEGITLRQGDLRVLKK